MFSSISIFRPSNLRDLTFSVEIESKSCRRAQMDWRSGRPGAQTLFNILWIQCIFNNNEIRAMFTAQELAQKKVYFKQLSSEISQVPQPTLLSSQLENLTTVR